MQKMCFVCLEEGASSEFVKFENCPHEMHSACRDKWLRVSVQAGRTPTCPICRKFLYRTNFIMKDKRVAAPPIDIMQLRAALGSAALATAEELVGIHNATRAAKLADMLREDGGINADFIAHGYWALGVTTTHAETDSTIEPTRRPVYMMTLVLARALRTMGLRVHVEIDGMPLVLEPEPDVLFTSNRAHYEQFRGLRWGVFTSDQTSES